MKSLPLSWTITNPDVTNNTIINRWKINWYAIREDRASVSDYNFDSSNNKQSDILIRGCNLQIKNELESSGYRSILVGKEAILDTKCNHFNKKSIIDLIKRGKRHGQIFEIEFSDFNKMKLEELKSDSTHGSEPQLKNLFQVEFNLNNLLYVFIDSLGTWLGAIMLSKNSNDKLHTELILRRINTPIGIMEALIEYSFKKAKEYNFSNLSLGEVPFIINQVKPKKSLTALTVRAGKIFRFAYNFQHLYNFKNKFNPIWEDIYICSSSNIGLKKLLFLLIYSNFHKLIIFKLIFKAKNNFLMNFFKKNKIFVLRQLDFNKT